MALMVEEQDPMIQTIEAKANEAEVDTGAAETQLQKAVKSARAARRKRWICFVRRRARLGVVGMSDRCPVHSACVRRRKIGCRPD
jgi:syntaxin 1B/2/3